MISPSLAVFISRCSFGPSLGHADGKGAPPMAKCQHVCMREGKSCDQDLIKRDCVCNTLPDIVTLLACTQRMHFARKIAMY